MLSSDGRQVAGLRSAENGPAESRSAGSGFSRFLQRNCFWLLVGCYILAAVWPQPGLAMREWQWTPTTLPAARFTLPLVLLSLLLFCAAVQTDVAQVRAIGSRPWALLWGTLTVWVAPVVLFLAAAVCVPLVADGASTAGILVGLALVASMPVANSSVGWTQLVRGNLALSLALVLVTIFLCPWVTPWMLGWLRLTLSTPDQTHFQTLIDSFSGAFFIIWVVLPTAAGLACRHALGKERVAAIASWLTLTSVASLLMLNYVNAALALPEVFEHSRIAVLAITAILAAAVSAIGMAAGWCVARVMRLDHETRLSLMFGLGMKHTGLALLLAGAVLAQERLAILMIVLATLAQHLLAGLVQMREQGG
jgi:bile acid:Na+ symporter, BASS family